MNRTCILILVISSLCAVLTPASQVSAQSSDQEVFLQFRHEGVINSYISSLYHRDQFYLSVSELFSALSIDYNIDGGQMQITGNFIGQGTYVIQFDSRTRQARFNDRSLQLTADDYILSELGYYLSPDIYDELFDMDFRIDFNNLILTLESEDVMPVIAQRERERQRERMLRRQREIRREFFPLRFDRNKQILDGGYFDYNLTGNYGNTGNSFLYNTSLGTELLGGDLQGTVFGNVSENSSAIRSSGLRWRYGILKNDWISSVTAGQTTSKGLLSVAYSGIEVTNEPLEPRFLYGETAFTGIVEPNAEVELYRNNSLVDFVQADESGQYRFLVPVTYGSSNYSIRVYSPTGQISTRDLRLQVPFNFLPPGEINYTVSAGRLDNPISGSTERGFMSKANVSAGLTDRFSASTGVEYFDDFHDNLPTLKAALSSRILENYLVSVEAASQAYYRATGSVVYPSNASVSLDYTRFNDQGGIYNPSRNISSWRTSVFAPFEVRKLPLFVRLNFSNEKRELSSVYRYRVDLNTRLGRANFRLGYRDIQVGNLSFTSSPAARLTASATYNTSRSTNIPTLFRGIFLRAQTNYIPSISEIEDAEIQLSRNIGRTGRVQFSAGRNFAGNFNLFRFGVTIDFSSFRSVSNIRSNRSAYGYTQSIRGSIGYDPSNRNTLFTNRQQVGRSGTAVRLFIDHNNSGTYESEEDELIPENAVRIDRAGGVPVSKDSIHYLSQLQPYRQYNMSINTSVITNPLLVPQLENFSFITDPNQYKIIDVPFYTSGIVEGTIIRTLENGTQSGLGGLRLYMRQVNVPEGTEPFEQELRTFSDGSFYAYEIPPGDYVIEPDSTQLAFLDAESDISQLEFSVSPLSQGDFVEGLSINIMPEQILDPNEAPPYILATLTERPDNKPVTPGLLPQTGAVTLEAATFLNFREALQFAELVETTAEIPFDIAYNSRNELYTVRSSNPVSSEQIPTILSSLSQISADSPALIMESVPDTVSSAGESPHIQLGLFESLEEATAHMNRLGRSLALPYDVFVYTDAQDEVYRVLNGPYRSDMELEDSLQRIILAGSPDENELILAASARQPAAEVQPDYRFSFNLGEFSTPDSASAFIEQFGEQLENVTLTMVQLDNGSYQVNTEEQTANWSELLELGTNISTVTNTPLPVARIVPTLPVQDASGTETESDNKITVPEIELETDTTRFRPILLDLAALPADTLIATGADTLVIRDSGVPVIEILEEEEFIIQPEDTLNTETSDLIDSTESDRCTYPVQVGSFGGNSFASDIASSISSRIDTDITLYYNENTELFALRTPGYENIDKATEKVREFRSMDPYNQYAIVEQCLSPDSEMGHNPARFLIRLNQFASIREAESFRESLPENLKEDVIIKETRNEKNLVDVFFGSFEKFDAAESSLNSLPASIVAGEPEIILDPLALNRFNLEFRVFFGKVADRTPVEAATDRLEQITGRRVTVTLHDAEATYLFEETVYGLWSQFLQELNSLSRAHESEDIAEIFIIDKLN